MEHQIEPNYLALITAANDNLMEKEHRLEQQRNAVSAARYYFAAAPCKETVLNLRGAMANLRADQAAEEKARQRLETLVQDVYEHME